MVISSKSCNDYRTYKYSYVTRAPPCRTQTSGKELHTVGAKEFKQGLGHILV